MAGRYSAPLVREERYIFQVRRTISFFDAVEQFPIYAAFLPRVSERDSKRIKNRLRASSVQRLYLSSAISIYVSPDRKAINANRAAALVS